MMKGYDVTHLVSKYFQQALENDDYHVDKVILHFDNGYYNSYSFRILLYNVTYKITSATSILAVKNTLNSGYYWDNWDGGGFFADKFIDFIIINKILIKNRIVIPVNIITYNNLQDWLKDNPHNT